MAEPLHALRPYKSFLLGRIVTGVTLKSFVASALEDLAIALDIGPKRNRIVEQFEPTTAGDLHVGGLHYLLHEQATWTQDGSVVDEVHHLVLVCRRSRIVALLLTDVRRREIVAGQFGRPGAMGLGALELIHPGLLNAAFVRGTARTLWLSGTHPRSSVKADSKVLSGLDLRDALDPLGDQTYYFTAARSVPHAGTLQQAVGVTPRRSRVWLGPTRSWEEFHASTSKLLADLEAATAPEEAPLPVLALSTIDETAIADAFDVAVVPPELFTDDSASDSDERATLERWAYRARFDVRPSKGRDLRAAVMLSGIDLGTLTFRFSKSNSEHPSWLVTATPTPGHDDELEEARRLCERPALLKVWYESGHTLSDGAFFSVRHRDFPFQGFVWTSFPGTDVTKEKPDPLPAIGAQDSLFCWVRKRWPRTDGGKATPSGWLACDDGAMEVADFIHFDENSAPPVLSLIHVKSAKSAAPGRGISVAAYEVVVSQAIKNLRHLDRVLLGVNLHNGMKKRVGNLVWHKGKPSTRAHMLKTLSRVGSSYMRQVVILQPHVCQVRWESHVAADVARRRQLNTLLLGAEAACHGLGAKLLVLGDGRRSR